jgi:hypothetical protein
MFTRAHGDRVQRRQHGAKMPDVTDDSRLAQLRAEIAKFEAARSGSVAEATGGPLVTAAFRLF